ncbi:urea carboxylase [Paenibacillus daejeonensis]|uniref:urea carboxylase n=1 Tax=Paenibacillus daejeonensis TaxID=135193 RepID=UPI000382D0BA|nr:urea carboxylase [Paenibacillus daejeonensis]
MFDKILIANRGAIAVRIERTLRGMGIASVAVYTEADQDSLHVDGADEAIRIGEGPAKDSYLNAELILRTAIETGAQAIHPGYGFLSENAAFARACHAQGIVFIGPSPEQIELFGLKHTARAVAERAGVPLLPGTGLITSVDEAASEAKRIGYPVILKSTAGGGGIGMRVCESEAALREAYDTVGYLAENNFSNGGMFLEKYIARARHVEVQIFGNRFGEVVALGERDCSVQRRNQKVLEETPAPNLPEQVRTAMLESARSLAAEAGYRSAGTVEYLYDPDSCEFYFLEVNTRLQVEHGVTEEVLGLDLVEWMVREAADELTGLATLVPSPTGHSIQARIYAEDCLQQFRPSAGRLDAVQWPSGARVETWVRDGLTVTTLYDPMLAKIIVHGRDREEALAKLTEALAATRLYGITANLSYLEALLAEPGCRSGALYTTMLERFAPAEHALEVLDGGVQTTIQDWPGRTGHWDVGVPPCGPMDPLSFRIGNRLLGNDPNAAGLELTLRGGAYRFRNRMRFCLAGADMTATLDGVPVPRYIVVQAEQGQELRLGEAVAGMRTYLLVAGGFDMPQQLGSASTFTLGGFGGHGGRALRTGDILAVRRGTLAAASTDGGLREPDQTGQESAGPVDRLVGAAGVRGLAVHGGKAGAPVADCKENFDPGFSRHWTLGVIPGPHCSGEFLQPEYLAQLTGYPWEIHFNSSRTGVRLIGPAPLWAREDGGEAGLHPSNIHDNAYAIGTLDLTGDMPILLGPDGPSLGGFVCPVTTASAELWKIGQLRPGDTVTFQLLTLEEADELRERQEHGLQELESAILPADCSLYEGLAPAQANEELLGDATLDAAFESSLPIAPERLLSPDYPVLASEREGRRFPLTIRCSGDSNLLVEYGELELDLLLRFQVHALMQAIQESGILPVLDLTPGIRSLQVHIDPSRMNVQEACEHVLTLDAALPPIESMCVPSRIVHLPLSWDDPATQLAIERYQANVRPDAPWCPSNLEFIRRINGLDSEDEVRRIVYEANYLVLGLGDVYLGAPVATPTDPRHRLVTTKYNPARTWTPENAVGIGGAYMCVYGMEGPGGYQFVGRTIQMWNQLHRGASFEEGKPWLLRFFDQIRFYPVEAAELLRLREDFPRGHFEPKIEETTFDLGEYVAFLRGVDADVESFRFQQQTAFRAERDNWRSQGLAEYISVHDAPESTGEESLPEGAVPVRCNMPGSVWRVLVQPGDRVAQGDALIIEESMKMEFRQDAPCDGIVGEVFVKPGDEVQAGQLIVSLLGEELAAV